MKLSDELLLKSLRADVLGGVSDDQWVLVCKAVDDAGDIREVRGYARTVIFDAIEKFNPYHDELGQFTSGGAGGASAGSARGGSLTASDLQGLDNENASILQSSMQHEDNTEAFRMSNPYRANNAKVLLANLVAAQKWSEEHKQYTGKLYSEIAKEPFLDTTDIEPDMGTEISSSRKAELGKKYPNAGMVVDLPSPTGQRTSEETARIVRNIAAARSQRKIDPAGWLGDGSKQRLPDIPGSKRKKK